MPDHQAGDIDHIEEELNTHMLKKRSIVGALMYTSRTAILQAISLVAVFLLTIFLNPAEYGLFFVVDATVGFLVYFSDIGLAAALIQKKNKITNSDIATTFTVQQIIVVTLSILALIFSTQIASFFDYSDQALILFRTLVVAFFLSSLKTIPSILLERDLHFNKLVIPQILENLVFYAVAVAAAWQGRGISSFTYAVLARAVVGLVAIYILRPWKPRFGLDFQVAKKLVSFGAPFQANSIMSLFKDRLLIIFLGKVLPIEQVGYLGWAEKWAMTPIRFFAEPILKVTFPAYSRLQENAQELKKAIEKSIFFVAFLVFPSAAGIVAIAPVVVAIIPKYSKWEPALIALAFYSLNAVFSSISITLTNTLNATGRVKDTLKLMVMWTVLTWILTPTLISIYGFNGVAIASAITASSSIIGLYFVRKIINISIIPQILKPLISAFIMAVIVFSLAQYLPDSIYSIITIITTGAFAYLLLMFGLARNRLFQEMAIIKKYLKKS